MSCNCSELEKPPSKSNMGVFQIIELAVMVVVAILSTYDLINYLSYYTFDLWSVLVITMDICVIVGLIFIIIGLFFSGGSSKLRIGIILFFIGAVIAIAMIIRSLIYDKNLQVWLIDLIKGAILVFLAFILWKQSKNV